MTDNIENYYRVEKALKYLKCHFKEHPNLDAVAREVYVSPFHFQRLFKDWVGISPKKFLQYLTLDYLRAKIQETQNMIDAAELAGLSSQSRVHDLFVTLEGVSPQQYKTGGEGMQIRYGYHPSPFGLCFIAVSEKGICALKFIDKEASRNEFELFAAQWHNARLVHLPDYTQGYIARIFRPNHVNPEKLHLLVQGTDFQLKVWEAMLTIPFGSVCTFGQVAAKIGQPDAARAVSSAVAKNTLIYLIPCHRIVTAGGTFGAYNYGRVRKQAMIGWEMQKLEEN